MNLLEYVGKRIRQLRSSYGGGIGLSQEVLAKKINVSTNTISRWETATYRPSIEDLEQLARFFNVTISEFFPSESEQANSRVMPLLRAAKDLPDEDLEELRCYAEYRKSRHILTTEERRWPGRRKKD